MKPPYGYIAVEGLIGAGKTTLAKRLAAEWDAETVLEEAVALLRHHWCQDDVAGIFHHLPSLLPGKVALVKTSQSLHNTS